MTLVDEQNHDTSIVEYYCHLSLFDNDFFYA